LPFILTFLGWVALKELMMNKWKDLLVVSTFWSGLSLYASRGPEAQTPAPPAKGASSDSAAKTVVPPAKDTSAADRKALEDRYLYLFGQISAHHTGAAGIGLNSQQAEMVVSGYKDAINGGNFPQLNPEDAEGIQGFFGELKEKHTAELRRNSEALLAKKRNEPGIQSTASGALYRVTKPGDNVRANPDSFVKIDYEERSDDGSVLGKTEGDTVLLVMLPPGLAEAIQQVGQGGELQTWTILEDGTVLELFVRVLQVIVQPTLGNGGPNEPAGEMGN
jgi:FKBP-type peptidyl-prolyl cis-trans isomerase